MVGMGWDREHMDGMVVDYGVELTAMSGKGKEHSLVWCLEGIEKYVEQFIRFPLKRTWRTDRWSNFDLAGGMAVEATQGKEDEDGIRYMQLYQTEKEVFYQRGMEGGKHVFAKRFSVEEGMNFSKKHRRQMDEFSKQLKAMSGRGWGARAEFRMPLECATDIGRLKKISGRVYSSLGNGNIYLLLQDEVKSQWVK